MSLASAIISRTQAVARRRGIELRRYPSLNVWFGRCAGQNGKAVEDNKWDLVSNEEIKLDSVFIWEEMKGAELFMRCLKRRW